MNTNPNKNRIVVNHILIAQFRRKGYKCQEVQEQKATTIIITHGKKQMDAIRGVIGDINV